MTVKQTNQQKIYKMIDLVQGNYGNYGKMYEQIKNNLPEMIKSRGYESKEEMEKYNTILESYLTDEILEQLKLE